MSVTIEEFPTNPGGRQHCYVWTRARDGQRVIFGCDSRENCEKRLAHFQERARLADKAGLDVM